MNRSFFAAGCCCGAAGCTGALLAAPEGVTVGLAGLMSGGAWLAADALGDGAAFVACCGGIGGFGGMPLLWLRG